jgi:energy-coupling factor transporter transmembrane protein EcfT
MIVEVIMLLISLFVAIMACMFISLFFVSKIKGSETFESAVVCVIGFLFFAFMSVIGFIVFLDEAHKIEVSDCKKEIEKYKSEEVKQYILDVVCKKHNVSQNEIQGSK